MGKQLLAVALAALLVLAGDSSTTDTRTSPATDAVSDAPTESGGSGTVNFYVSDERNAIGDFEHLNVTITAVSFHAADGEGEVEDAEGDDENTTETPEVAADAEDEQEEGDWVVREVNETTVDLTELQGDNATMLSRMALPNGTYDQVRIHVSDVNGTLAGASR